MIQDFLPFRNNLALFGHKCENPGPNKWSDYRNDGRKLAVMLCCVAAGWSKKKMSLMVALILKRNNRQFYGTLEITNLLRGIVVL